MIAEKKPLVDFVALGRIHLPLRELVHDGEEGGEKTFQKTAVEYFTTDEVDWW